MFSVVVHLVELVSNHMLRWIGLKLVTMWIAQKCISVNARIHIQSGLKLVRNCSVNRPITWEVCFSFAEDGLKDIQPKFYCEFVETNTASS